MTTDIKDLFVPYEIAVLAKNKGFNGPCFGFYLGNELKIRKYTYSKNNINSELPNNGSVLSAPLYQQLTDWFREVYKINVCWKPSESEKYNLYVFEETQLLFCIGCLNRSFNEALNAAITKAFELI